MFFSNTSLNLVKYEIYHFHRGFINLAGVFLSIYFVSNHKNQASKIYALLFCFFFFFNFFCFLSFNPMNLSNFWGGGWWWGLHQSDTQIQYWLLNKQFLKLIYLFCFNFFSVIPWQMSFDESLCLAGSYELWRILTEDYLLSSTIIMILKRCLSKHSTTFDIYLVLFCFCCWSHTISQSTIYPISWHSSGMLGELASFYGENHHCGDLKIMRCKSW